MKNFARIIAPLALFALAAVATVACSDPEIDHYTNPGSDVYLDRLLGIEGAGDNADSVLFAMAKSVGCYSTAKTDTITPHDTAGALECMRDWLEANEDSLLAANAPVSSEKGSSAKSSSASGSSDEGESSEGDASSSSDEFPGYDCENILEWERGVPATMYEDGLCHHEVEGADFVFECLEETMCKSVTPGTNISVWREKGPCR